MDVNLPEEAVNWKRIELSKIWTVEEDRVPTKEELRLLMDYGGFLDRVTIAVMSSSGIRENTLVNLVLGDVDLESHPDMGVIRVRPEAAKERVTYVTFLSPEAKALLFRSQCSSDGTRAHSPLLTSALSLFLLLALEEAKDRSPMRLPKDLLHLPLFGC